MRRASRKRSGPGATPKARLKALAKANSEVYPTRRATAEQAADRGFADVLTMSFPAAKALEARRTESYNAFLELIARARNSGHLREDFVPEDLVILQMANAGVVAAAGDDAPDTWRRLVGHMIRSYAAPGAPIPAVPEAPAPTTLFRTMVRLARTGPGSVQAGGAAPSRWTSLDHGRLHRARPSSVGGAAAARTRRPMRVFPCAGLIGSAAPGSSRGDMRSNLYLPGQAALSREDGLPNCDGSPGQAPGCSPSHPGDGSPLTSPK
jgi:hypothetical protein